MLAGNINPGRLLGVAILLLLALPAAADATKPSFSAPAEFSLLQRFDWKARDYVATCTGDSLTLEIDGQHGWRAKVPDDKPASGDFTFTAGVEDGQSVDLSFKRKRDGYSRHFHVRCLPADFPDWSFNRVHRGGPKLFMVQMPDFYSAIFNRDGVPVWWMQTDGFTDDAKILADGTISWNSVAAGDAMSGAFDIRRLNGKLIQSVGDEDTDVHDLQLLPNGNYVIAQQTYRTDLDTSAYGGSANAAVRDYDIEEVTPDGDVVRSWKTDEHIGLDETGRWWDQITGAIIYDITHWNAVDIDGRYMYLSFRHLDAIYKVDRKTGEIIWKLGGTETPESLEVRNDPRDYPIGAQHDVRVLPDGTVTIHNNRTGLDDPVPRAERFRIDEEAGTATLVDSITDPKVETAQCCGSARRLPSKDWLVGWGRSPIVGAYDKAGNPYYRYRLTDSFTYRANPVEYADTGDLRKAMNQMSR